MSEEAAASKFSNSNFNKLDLILLTLQRLQEDLHLAKCEIKTSIREVKLQHDYVIDSLTRLRRDVGDIGDRLHGIELKQERQNSST